MKIERRGKFPGVKVHLDGDEAKRIMEDCASSDLDFKRIAKLCEKAGGDPDVNQMLLTALQHTSKLAKKIAKEFAEYPTLFEDRTDEEIKTELETELKAAGDKLALIEKGKDWKHK